MIEYFWESLKERWRSPDTVLRGGHASTWEDMRREHMTSPFGIDYTLPLALPMLLYNSASSLYFCVLSMSMLVYSTASCLGWTLVLGLLLWSKSAYSIGSSWYCKQYIKSQSYIVLFFIQLSLQRVQIYTYINIHHNTCTPWYIIYTGKYLYK